MAVIEAGEENCEGCSIAKRGGSVKMETTDIVRACHSFWEVVRGQEAGATGAEGAFRARQHAGVRQFLQSQQHELVAGELAITASEDMAATGRANRINPTSNATAILVSLCAMPVLWSVLIHQPCKSSQIGVEKQNTKFAGVQIEFANPTSKFRHESGSLIY